MDRADSCSLAPLQPNHPESDRFLALTAVGLSLGVALEAGLSAFRGVAPVVVGRFALEFKSSLGACIDAAVLLNCCRWEADAKATDQETGERSGDGAFCKFHDEISQECAK